MGAVTHYFFALMNSNHVSQFWLASLAKQEAVCPKHSTLIEVVAQRDDSNIFKELFLLCKGSETFSIYQTFCKVFLVADGGFEPPTSGLSRQRP